MRSHVQLFYLWIIAILFPNLHELRFSVLACHTPPETVKNDSNSSSFSFSSRWAAAKWKFQKSHSAERRPLPWRIFNAKPHVDNLWIYLNIFRLLFLQHIYLMILLWNIVEECRAFALCKHNELLRDRLTWRRAREHSTRWMDFYGRMFKIMIIKVVGGNYRN